MVSAALSKINKFNEKTWKFLARSLQFGDYVKGLVFFPVLYAKFIMWFYVNGLVFRLQE